MKKIIFAILATFALATCATAEPFDFRETSKIGASLTLFEPTDSNAKMAGSSWLGFTLNYHLKFDEYERPTLAANLGFFSQDKEHNYQPDIKGSFVPFTLSYTKYAKEPENGFFYGAEAGFALAKYKIQKNYYGNGWNSESGILPILAGTVGYNFGTYYYASFKYYLPISDLDVPNVGSVGYDGWALSIGTRFTF